MEDFNTSFSNSNKKNVLIAGAGLSGMSAAHNLKQNGYQVTLLEASNRAGGRIYTIREPFAYGQYVEAGAVFLGENQPRTMKWIRQLGVSVKELNAGDLLSFCYVRGKKYFPNAEGHIDWPVDLGLKENEIRNVFKYLGTVLPELGDVTSPSWPSEKLRKYDCMTFSQLLREAGASEAAIRIIRLGYVDLFGNGIDETSALCNLRDFTLMFSGRKSYIIEGGSDYFPNAFAKELSKDIIYDSAVVKIERTKEGVSVTCRNKKGDLRSWTADHFISTIPFPVLKNIPITPPLSPEKQSAINELPLTPVTRSYTQISNNSLEQNGLYHIAQTDIPIFNWVRNATLYQEGSGQIFEAYLTGHEAIKFDALSPEAKTELILTKSEPILPGITQNCIQSAVYSWQANPWQLGGYAWFRPGQFFSLWPHVFKPEGRIHFAGDHTSPYPGWMEGAFISAERVVQEILTHDLNAH